MRIEYDFDKVPTSVEVFFLEGSELVPADGELSSQQMIARPDVETSIQVRNCLVKMQ